MGFSRKTRILAGLLRAGLVAALALQRRQISSLQATNLAQQESLTAQRETPPASQVTPIEQRENDELEQLRKDNRDLLRLRNEVGQLRERQRELEEFRKENDRLKTLVERLEHGSVTRRFQFTPDNAPRPAAWICVNIVAQRGNENLNPGTERVVIGSVAANSPAAEAQLEEGDVLLRADGEAITNLIQFRDWVINGTPGQPLVLDVLREITERQVTVIRKPPPQ